ncbi:MAG TPA: DNA alkylation repair protein [Trueperaceae bacterium]|nr:DNA alkylation repair protein [Trueperaceae bacterium]
MAARTADIDATVGTLLAELEALGNETTRERNARLGAGENQFGVLMGAIRKVAARIKTDHALGVALWATGNLEARLVAVLIMQPKKLSSAELDTLVRSARFAQLADWLNSYVVKNHPDKERLRVKWLDADDPWAARAGWNLTAGRIARSPEGLDLSALLRRIEVEMPHADPAAQWTMNNCLAGIGIHHPALRERAVSIGDALGIFRDYPVSKGCISPFAPIWIAEMSKRQEQASGQAGETSMEAGAG